MIDLHLVVQHQRVIAVAPVVADALFAIDDQRIDLQLTKPRRDRKPGLSAADDQHRRIVVAVIGCGLPQIEPIGAAEIARIGGAIGPRPADRFLEPFKFVECGQQRPRLERVAAARIGRKRQYAAAAPLGGLEFEDRFDRAGTGAGDRARRRAVGIDPEIRRTGAAAIGLQRTKNGVRAVDRADLPGQGQQVAPIAVGMEQRPQRRVIRFRQRPLELSEPILNPGRDGYGSGQHSALQGSALCVSGPI